MPKIPRFIQKVFGVDLTPASNIAQIGSLQARAPLYTTDLAVMQALANFGLGMNGVVIGNRSPAKQDLTALFYMITQQLACILQSGIPEYNADTTYFVGQLAREPDSPRVFSSLTNDNQGNGLTSTGNWAQMTDLLKGPTVCAAWVVFDGINTDGGGNSLIRSQLNVNTVTKNAGGSYTVNFATPLPSHHYTVTGSCGSEDGQPYGVGDDAVVVGNITGQGNAIRSENACRFFTINPTNKALVASGCVSVLFFTR